MATAQKSTPSVTISVTHSELSLLRHALSICASAYDPQNGFNLEPCRIQTHKQIVELSAKLEFCDVQLKAGAK